LRLSPSQARSTSLALSLAISLALPSAIGHSIAAAAITARRDRCSLAGRRNPAD
jgi:hypothetical protein